MPPPETTGTAMPAPLEQCQRAFEPFARCPGLAVGKVISPSNSMWGIRIPVARQIERLLRPLYALPTESGIAFDQEAHIDAGRFPASDTSRATTSLSSTTVMRGERAGSAP